MESKPSRRSFDSPWLSVCIPSTGNTESHCRSEEFIFPSPERRRSVHLGCPPWKRERIKLSLNAPLNPHGKPVLKRTARVFAPLRSCQDAIGAIFLASCKKPKYALDAASAGCFDTSNQEALLHKLNTYPVLKQAIQAWLKAGMIDQGIFEPTPRGTPQGGVISPLLMNVALHG
jgi:RNA-directed DNA polymerase